MDAFAPYSNICPISGWTRANIYRTGANVFDEASADMVDGETYGAGGVVQSSTNYSRTNAYLSVKPSADYTFSYNQTAEVYAAVVGVYYDGDKNVVGTATIINSTNTKGHKTGSFTTPSNAVFMRLAFAKNRNSTMINVGSAEIAYEPYNGTTIPISWSDTAGTVYGGTLTDNGDGTWTLTVRPYYASYNGETLVGPWVSSMDVYAEGATPTTGAQVVDLGGAETVYTLTAESVRTLLGNNNIFADTGNINTITYRER